MLFLELSTDVVSACLDLFMVFHVPIACVDSVSSRALVGWLIALAVKAYLSMDSDTGESEDHVPPSRMFPFVESITSGSFTTRQAR